MAFIARAAASALLVGLTAATPSPAIESEISAMEPVLASLLDMSINGAEKGASYNRTADFCDYFGHRISGSQNLEDSIDSLAPSLRRAGLENVHYEPAMVPHWVSPGPCMCGAGVGSSGLSLSAPHLHSC